MQGKSKNEIDVCLHGLYALLLLKLGNKTITDGTQYAVGTFSRLMALLVVRYKDIENDPDKFIVN